MSNNSRLSSENEICTKMKVMKLKDLCKYRMVIFVFNHRNFFQLHNTELKTRNGGGIASYYPNWRKIHSKMQARYQGLRLFNGLPETVRNERRLSSYENAIREIIFET